MWRYIFNDDGAAANLGALTDRDRSEHHRADADSHIVLERWMALASLLAGAAERHALVQRDPIADLARLADHHTHAVVDEETPADRRAGMDLDTGEESANLRDQPWYEWNMARPQGV